MDLNKQIDLQEQRGMAVDALSRVAALLSEPDINPRAVSNYLHWYAAAVHPEREHDAFPLLADFGGVRMEWERNGDDYTVEVGSENMWLLYLSQDPSGSGDWDSERPFDAETLTKFFLHGLKGVARG